MTKRIMAFLLDAMLVLLVSSMLSNVPRFNPYMEDYEATMKEYEEQYADYMETLTERGSNNPIEKMDNMISLTKKIERTRVYVIGYFIVFYILYNVLFQYFNNGATIGKRVFKLKVVDKNGDKCSITKLFIRTLFNGSTLVYGITIFTIIKSLLVLVSNNMLFYSLYAIITFVSFAFEISMIITLIKTTGNKATHDLISGTKVISYK